MNRYLTSLLAVVSLSFTAATAAFPYAIDLYPGITPEGLLTIGARFQSRDLLASGLTNQPLSFAGVIGYGFAPQADVRFLGLLTKMIVRYDLSGGKNLAIIGTGLDASSVEPRYDLFLPAGPFALEFNLTARIPFLNPETNYQLKAYFSPVIRLSTLAFFVQSITAYSPSGFVWDIAPGFQWNGDRYGTSAALYFSDILKTSPKMFLELLFWIALPQKTMQKTPEATNLKPTMQTNS